MPRSRTVQVLLILWVLCMAASAASLALEPTGDSFTRGLNRVIWMLAFQIAACLLAIPLWLHSRQEVGLARWIARLPGVLALALGAGLAVLFISVARGN